MLLQEQRKEHEHKNRRGRISLLGTGILAVATLLGYSVLIPRVTPVASDPVDSNDPFSASVTITNTGYLPVNSVSVSIAVGKITSISSSGKPVSFVGADHFSSKIFRTDWQRPDLGLDDGFTIALNDVFTASKQRLVSADIAVVIDYEIPLIHWNCEKIFPLYARRQSNGNFYWYKNPPRN
jgi:hypothetical protein